MFSTKALVKPSSIVVYSKYEGTRFRTNLPKLNAREASASRGLFSRLSARRFRNAIENLVYTATYKTVFVRATNTYFRYKLNFITLTLPSVQVHTDKEIVDKVLSPFLEAWQKRRKGFLYVWKAEVQDNGNLHFHLTTNSFIHYEKLRINWNKAINKLGYVDRSGIENPNSTDVHAVSNIKNLAGYLCSYMAKKDLYKKPLKRWLKIYKSQLSNKNKPFNKLPKRYLQNIKRRVTCNLWNASKPLASKGVTIDYEDGIHKTCWRVLEIAKEYAINNDYVYIYPLEFNAIKQLPSFDKALRYHLDKLLKIQSYVPSEETIETL